MTRGANCRSASTAPAAATSTIAAFAGSLSSAAATCCYASGAAAPATASSIAFSVTQGIATGSFVVAVERCWSCWIT